MKPRKAIARSTKPIKRSRIRQKTMPAPERDERAAVRAAVFARDGYRCRLADVPDAGQCWGGLSVHHVLKASAGGAYDVGNLVTLCIGMNDRLESNADLAALARSLGLVKRRGDRETTTD